jgi:acetate kinase
MKILVLNSGSSSQKVRLYDMPDVLPAAAPVPLWDAKAEWGTGQTSVVIKTARSGTQTLRVKAGARADVLEQILATLWGGKSPVLQSKSEVAVVGHRVVHGGAEFTQPVLVTPEVKRAIARLSKFAPLHNRAELEGIELVEKQLGPVKQVAVFDTGFHRHLPLPAAVYPGPYEWYEHGIRRYGFHGINHQYCSQRAAEILSRDLKTLKLVSCHLGNGCSLAAIRDGHSVDTTMGFTPLEGLMMGTRSGSVDPGILTYLLRERRISGQELDDLLNSKSGLLGVSGASSDMRNILAAMRGGQQRAKLAFDIYLHRLRAAMGAMIAVLRGIDCLVFTAGVGENSPEVRGEACAAFEYIGLRLDAAKNAQSSADQDIAAPDSRVRVLIIRAEEDWAIARDCQRLTAAQD